MNRAMLRMVTVREPERLVELVRFRGGKRTNHDYPHFRQLRETVQRLEGLMVYSWLGEADVVIGSKSELARIEMASGCILRQIFSEPTTRRFWREGNSTPETRRVRPEWQSSIKLSPGTT